jgi:hypothetical protein
MRSIRHILSCACLLLAAAAPALAQSAAGAAASTGVADDRDAVRAAVLDYVEALYDVDPRRIERSVHPELAKRGFARRGPGVPYDEMLMNYEQLHALAGRWNSDRQVDARTAPKEIDVLDVLDQTAAAKLTAEWGTDYLLLAKYEGRWLITHVLWQTPPHPQAESFRSDDGGSTPSTRRAGT